MSAQKDLFEECGLEVAPGEVSVGGTYPLFGMITQVLEECTGILVCELNFGIRANLFVSDDSMRQTIKERVFESGIFVSTVINKEPQIEVNCRTVVFGKKQELNA
jgi:hypothetical protein